MPRPSSTPTSRGARDDLVDAIRSSQAAAGDPVRAAAQQRYMKSAMPFHGVTSADVRAIATAELTRSGAFDSWDTWQATIRELWDGATHREERYAALTIARHRTGHRFREQGALDLYRHLVVTGAWWDLVDETATHLVRDELLAEPRRVAPVVRAWSADDSMWIRRAAILSQVGACERADLELLSDVIEPNLERRPPAGAGGKQDFFIRKAIGWALRDAARRHPEWVRAFVAERRGDMAPLTVREALKHLA